MSGVRVKMTHATWQCVLLWLLPATIGAGTASLGQDEVLLVNSHAVSAEEFKWFMEQERPHVVASFATRYGLEYGKDFWTHKFDGKTPRMRLKQETVSRVVREKIEQALFQELGLAQDIHYSAFLRDLERVNQEREQAVRQGRVVYGPVHYSQLQYYGHWKASLRSQAMEKLADNRLQVTPEALKAFYKQNRNRFKSEGTFTLEVATVETKAGAEARNEAPGMQAIAHTILSRLTTGQSPNQAMAGYEGKATVSSRRFDKINRDRLGELFTRKDDLDKIASLAPGQAAIVTNSDASVLLVKCTEKVPEALLAYEDVKEAVRAGCVQQQYGRLIDELAGKARVVTNPEAINSLLP